MAKKIESLASKQRRTREIITLLKEHYPDAKCSLEYQTPFQLLVATVLSAQCTDIRVNLVTPVLFGKYPDPKSLSRAEQSEIEKIIRPTGFFRTKALALKELSTDIVDKYKGEVPRTIEELTWLRGVGRKTANVVLGNAFGKNVGIVVDTHVGRITRRLGLSFQDNPVKVETDLVELVPRKDWTVFSHLLIEHGRGPCTARTKPKCDICFLRPLCPYGK
jgi:endonuclease-3